jgi:Fur-regulated basic protein A
MAEILQQAINKRKCSLISKLMNSECYIGDFKYLNTLTLTELEKEYRDLKSKCWKST